MLWAPMRSPRPIDLRSDTVTRPTDAMREAMMRAEVGDDVYGDDPTVNALEDEVAHLTGKEAALFVSSGTMGNQIAIATQTRPGDDVVVGEGAHPIFYEAAAGAALNGVQFSVAGAGGFFTPDELDAAVHPRAPWAPRTSLVSIENTHNRAGGRVWRPAAARAVADHARALGFASHLDGARIWNASVACGVDVATLCAPFDTVSVCFSKALGAPVGSAFCASRDLVAEARRIRKRWGGAMRQVGILAAAARHALAHHRGRLAEDHANARALAESMASVEGARVDLATVETNLVNIDVVPPAAIVAREAHALGLMIGSPGPHRLRAATHLDVSREEIDTAAEILARAIRSATNAVGTTTKAHAPG
jgi:threonine aldolase